MKHNKNMLKLIKTGDRGTLFLFEGSGWLFPYMDKINGKLREYEDTAFINELDSTPDSISVLLKLIKASDLTQEDIEIRKQKFLEYFEKISSEIIKN